MLPHKVFPRERLFILWKSSFVKLCGMIQLDAWTFNMSFLAFSGIHAQVWWERFWQGCQGQRWQGQNRPAVPVLIECCNMPFPWETMTHGMVLYRCSDVQWCFGAFVSDELKCQIPHKFRASALFNMGLSYIYTGSRKKEATYRDTEKRDPSQNRLVLSFPLNLPFVHAINLIIVHFNDGCTAAAVAWMSKCPKCWQDGKSWADRDS